METKIASSTRPNYLKLINTVERDWVKLQKDINETKKVSLFSLHPLVSPQAVARMFSVKKASLKNCKNSKGKI